MKKGHVEDLDTAIDLQKMARVIDRIGEIFEEEALTEDEAVWAAALSYMSTYNATGNFVSTEALNVAARALLRESSDVFDSLPEPGEDLDAPPAQGPGDDDDEADDDEIEVETEEEELEHLLDPDECYEADQVDAGARALGNGIESNHLEAGRARADMDSPDANE